MNTLRQDSLAGIVVFLVALPLCLGIACASGLPPFVGLLTGIIGGRSSPPSVPPASPSAVPPPDWSPSSSPPLNPRVPSPSS
ncbi:hypothetical protein FZ929_13515 [Klebsiella pneumoniae]|uniref:SLC26A/SulP transporter domain-containing protein n=1 Tax=Klebsiella pneumoniae TaxID=573 RepID=A0A5C2LHR1_KLEPN|nr:hypothetical protein FZ929_13515 [Klebsiella pneumoniae]